MPAPKPATRSAPEQGNEPTGSRPVFELTASMLGIVDSDLEIVADDDAGGDPYNNTGQLCRN